MSLLDSFRNCPGVPGYQRLSCAISVLLFLLLFLPGCPFFNLRSPEESSGEAVPWISPTSCAAVVFNIESALEAKSPGMTNYTNSLSDSFKFHGDPTDSATFYTNFNWDGFKNWTLAVERQTVETFLNATQALTTEWSIQDSVDLGAGDRLLNLTYSLRVTPQTGSTIESAGLAKMYFHEESGFYKVLRWDDSRGASVDTTWGSLKVAGRRAASR
ncbi:MAG: hypothetical protein QME66_11665 [Candidatus Eisenbacteria bacterium]|nr:hypothetical protein [Candidatus Eisenbacteria bacterium]